MKTKLDAVQRSLSSHKDRPQILGESHGPGHLTPDPWQHDEVGGVREFIPLGPQGVKQKQLWFPVEKATVFAKIKSLLSSATM